MVHTWGKAHAWGKAKSRGRSWVGLIWACGAAAVWSAYGLRPSHFDCLHQEWSDLTCMEHPWGKAHALGRRWSNGLTTSGASIGWRLQAGDESLQWQSVAWTIRTVVHPCWTICPVENRQVDKQPFTIFQDICEIDNT